MEYVNNKPIMAVISVRHEDQKHHCLIVAIAAVFDSICLFMAAVIMQRFYKTECNAKKRINP